MIHGYAPTQRITPTRVGIGEDYYHEEADAADRQEYYSPIDDVLERGDGDDIYRSLNRLLSRTHRDLGYKTARRSAKKISLSDMT